MDLQHGMVGFEGAIGMMQAISSTGAIPVVRPSANDAPQVMRLLDAGAHGVVCPMISTAAEAAQLVSAYRHPPAGRRSFGPARGLLCGGMDYLPHANDEILVLAMSKTKKALANLDAILDTPGLDGVYVGPDDLAIEMGQAPRNEHDHPDVMAAVARIFCSNGSATRMRVQQGFHLVTPGNDAVLLRQAMASAVRVARGA